MDATVCACDPLTASKIHIATAATPIAILSHFKNSVAPCLHNPCLRKLCPAVIALSWCWAPQSRFAIRSLAAKAEKSSAKNKKPIVKTLWRWVQKQLRLELDGYTPGFPSPKDTRARQEQQQVCAVFWP
jgi:hypothetical protein